MFKTSLYYILYKFKKIYIHIYSKNVRYCKINTLQVVCSNQYKYATNESHKQNKVNIALS